MDDINDCIVNILFIKAVAIRSLIKARMDDIKSRNYYLVNGNDVIFIVVRHASF